MDTGDQNTDLFLQVWQVEISRAIEIFTGEKPELTGRREERAGVAEDDAAGCLWWRQEFEADQTFVVWTGAREEAWVALGGGDAPEERCKQVYFDILRQTHDGVANALAGRTGKAYRCLGGEVKNPERVDGLDFREVEIGLPGRRLPCFLLAIEARPIAGPAGRQGRAEPTALKGLPALPAIKLGRLMEVELPLAVSLGRAVMPIREILKIAPGSVLELDRSATDYVDLLVHGRVVARGEIVSLKGNYGVRVLELTPQMDADEGE
jgi:flagellar motor switch protein FliN